MRKVMPTGIETPSMIADGHLGIWAALAELWPECQEQRCWNHRMLNVLDQVPQKKQAAVRQHLRAMMYADRSGVTWLVA